MKLKWKPWQIVLSAIAGVAVIGGGAAGVWYGVSNNNDLPEEPSVMVTETVTAEPALDEPTATATETETETEAEKEPDAVIVYVTPSESEPEDSDKENDQIRVDPPTTLEDNPVQPERQPL